MFRATEKFFHDSPITESTIDWINAQRRQGNGREKERERNNIWYSFHLEGPVEGIGSARENIYQPPLNMQLPFENSRFNEGEEERRALKSWEERRKRVGRTKPFPREKRNASGD